MANPRLITAIDVGTSKVCVIVGSQDGSSDPKVLAHSVAPCEGLSKGMVSDREATARAIRMAASAVQQKAGIPVLSAHVGITGAHIEFTNRRDTMDWVGKQGVISTEDLARAPQVVSQSTVLPGRKVIHALPTSYTLDGNEGILSPVGMHTNRMEVNTHVITGAMGFIDKLVDAVRSAGIEVDGLVLEPLASGRAVLHPAERQGLVALVDIGGGTTDLVVFNNGLPYYTTAISVGGFQFTNDISLMYDTSYLEAERVKLEHAHTEPERVSASDEVTMRVLGPSGERTVPLHDICQLVRERAVELTYLLKMKLHEAGVSDPRGVRVVLTGGASALPGLLDLMRVMVTPNIRIGMPNGNVLMPEELRAPSFSTSAGILLWASDQVETPPLNGAGGNGAQHSNGNGNGKTNGGNGKGGGPLSMLARPFRALRN